MIEKTISNGVKIYFTTLSVSPSIFGTLLDWYFCMFFEFAEYLVIGLFIVESLNFMIVAVELFMDADVWFRQQDSTVFTQDIWVVVMNQTMLPHLDPFFISTVLTELEERAATRLMI